MIPVSEPVVGAREIELVTDCLRTGWISSAGRYIELFERQWAGYCGRRFGIAVCNGTAALRAAVGALNIGPGDEVIVPTFTIVSCAKAVIEVGATPVWVDADPQTWTLDVSQVARHITPRTKAIMPVHIYGHPVDMDPLMDFARREGIAIIEDAAEAHGAEYMTQRGTSSEAWKRCGSFGEVSTFSFYANKLITTGEGGMVLTDDPAIADRLRSLRNLCFQSKRRFVHEELGDNLRMTNIQAALGVAQLERMTDIVARKRVIGRKYTESLRGVSGLQLPVEREWARNVYWMYGVVVDEQTGMTGADLAASLHQRGVETRPFFWGMHEQPVMRKLALDELHTHPVATRLARQGVYLPSGVGLSDGALQQVCAAVKEVMS